MHDALERARRAHGEAAVVLSHELAPGGGVTLSVGRETKKQGRNAPGAGTAGKHPAVLEVEKRLGNAGLSAERTDALLEDLDVAKTDGVHIVDVAAELLGGCFGLGASPKLSEKMQVVALVGPTGVGKTTTLAKLAGQLVRAGRKVSLATLDTYRVGAVEQLRAYADLLQVPMHVIRQRADVGRLLMSGGKGQIMLLDTTGRSPADEEHLNQLKEVLTSCFSGIDLTTYLLLSAATSQEGLTEILNGYSKTDPDGVIVTKLDETRRTARVLEFADDNSLPLSFLCDGQDVAGHLHMATPDRMADLILSGRCA